MSKYDFAYAIDCLVGGNHDPQLRDFAQRCFDLGYSHGQQARNENSPDLLYACEAAGRLLNEFMPRGIEKVRMLGLISDAISNAKGRHP